MSIMSKVRSEARDSFPALSLRASCLAFKLLSVILYPSSFTFKRRAAQTTVEYLLMLATVVGLALILAVLFHKKLLGGMFTMIGLVIGAGKPHH